MKIFSTAYRDDELVTASGAATLLGVSVRTVGRYREERRISFYRFSNQKIMYKIADLRDFVNKSYNQAEDFIE